MASSNGANWNPDRTYASTGAFDTLAAEAKRIGGKLSDVLGPIIAPTGDSTKDAVASGLAGPGTILVDTLDGMSGFLDGTGKSIQHAAKAQAATLDSNRGDASATGSAIGSATASLSASQTVQRDPE